MGFEQLAIVGVIVCGTIALLAFFNTLKISRQLGRKGPARRARRLVGTPEGATAAARSIVEELVRNHGPQVEEAKAGGPAGRELTEAIEEARTYYLSRVEARYKPVFHDVLDELVLGKKESST
ncbi:MAG: hypothetical protein MUC50_01480 [Myxococcota bacterium]|jgi:hypothetical protein|nr:hypothetical protein [Myxococcota bacterium]